LIVKENILRNNLVDAEETQADKGAINQVLKEIKSAYCNLSNLLDIDNKENSRTKDEDIKKVITALEEQKK